MKTQAELKAAHYRDVIIPMVAKYNYDHRADVKPWECVKLDGRHMICHPKFEYKPDIYTFAITILEGKPVFVGDKVYDKVTGYEVNATAGTAWQCYTWTPPTKKRTFVFNGVELPIPSKNKDRVHVIWGNEHFWFRSDDEYSQWSYFFGNLLTEARDKE